MARGSRRRSFVAAATGSGGNVDDMVRALTPTLFFDYLGVRVDALKAADNDLTINWRFTDLGEDYALTVRNGVLTHRAGLNAQADAGVTMSKATLEQISLKQLDIPTAIQKGLIKLQGNGKKLGELMTSLDTFAPQFNIVTP